MANPKMTLSIRDPGIGSNPNPERDPAYAGTAFSGTIGEVLETNDPQEVIDTFTRGPLVNAMLLALAFGAGPVRGVRVTGSVAASASVVTHTGAGAAEATLTGTADETLSIIAKVTLAGALGTGKVQWALDNFGVPGQEPTWSPEEVVPVSGIVTLTGTPHTLVFDDALGLGDTYEATTQAAHYGSTEIGEAYDALTLPENIGWDHVCFCGAPETAAAANTIAAAIGVRQLALFTNSYLYTAALSSASRAAASTIPAALTSTFARFLSLGYGTAYMAATQTRRGVGAVAMYQHEVAAALASVNLISTDLARTGNGPIPAMLGTDFDAFLEGDTLDDNRVSTFRTWPREIGFYVNNQRMLSNAESDFQHWQHAVCMLVACDVTYRRQWKYLSGGFRTEADGTIDPRDKSNLDSDVREGLANALTEPKNAEGTEGHVSSVRATVIKATSGLDTNRIESDVFMRPLFYPKEFRTTLQYSKSA